ncbi:MAG: hypothetical protein DRQ40_09690 [Gammaproteobacteria bacterium]|nr:MAG: hypothetical protein DRQ40_09690 [Gammaproteobacteria bacterium]
MIDDKEQEILIGESSNSTSIGEQLRQAREEKKLTLAEVAALLKLALDTLTKLEADDWEALHGRTYARGYLISYVKFLGLSEDELLSTFNTEYKPTEIEKTGPQKLNNDTDFPWLPVIMIVIVLVITWFAYQQWQVTENDGASVSELQSNEPSNEQSAVDTFYSSVVEPLPKSDSDIDQVSPEIPEQNNEKTSQSEQQNQTESKLSRLMILTGQPIDIEVLQTDLVKFNSGVKA